MGTMQTFRILAASFTLAVTAFVAPASAKLARCSAEAFPSIPNVRLLSAELVDVPVPHCKVAGIIGAETNFELLMPDRWNGKFVFGGGGGFVGAISNAALSYKFVRSLEAGWATVGTDTGHQGNSMDASWAYNNLERLVSFGHWAVHRTTVTAKPLIESFYGRKISRSVFFGCSRGGGQALMEAQRYPEDFDGIIAMAPAFNWTHELGARWILRAQTMFPDLTQIAKPVIGQQEQALISNAVMAQCDALDGLTDSILNEPRQCDFDIDSLACETKSTTDCLSPDQITAAKTIYGTFEIGGQMFPGAPFGAELPGGPLGWPNWTTGGYFPQPDHSDNADNDLFAAPAVPNLSWGLAIGIMRYFLYNDPSWSYVNYDFSDFDEKAARVASILNAENPDLSAFRARGGKLILDNGWMDASMSPFGTINYYENVLAFDPTANQDVRLFIRPGVAHCQGGPGPDGTDYLAAINQWLDTGDAPEFLEANFRGPEGGGRIICAFPGIVTYDGRGNSRDPKSFSCTVP